MPDAEASAIASGNIGRNSLVNDLARAAIERYPRIGELKALLEECGARAAQMTGSGSAIFGLFRDAPEAADSAHAIGSKAPDARVFEARSLDAPGAIGAD